MKDTEIPDTKLLELVQLAEAEGERANALVVESEDDYEKACRLLFKLKRIRKQVRKPNHEVLATISGHRAMNALKSITSSNIEKYERIVQGKMGTFGGQLYNSESSISERRKIYRRLSAMRNKANVETVDE